MSRRDERVVRVLDAIGAAALGPLPGPFCQAAVQLLAVSGAAVSVAGDEGFGAAILCRSDPVADRLEAIQMTLGEGPGRDATHTGWPVLEPDLAGACPGRWPAFTESALAAGASAVFAFPLRIGAIKVGVLGLYRTRPGPLSDEGFGDGLLLADYTAQFILGLAARGTPATLKDDGLGRLGAEVHQATGMVAVQLGVSLAEAFVRMQGKAFADGRVIGEVAADVVANRLRFDDIE